MTIWVDRLKDERRDLVLRVEALVRFKLTDEFRNLPEVTRKLINEQHCHMNAYADCLYYRLKQT